MKRIYHPEFPGVTQEVPDADAKSWKDAGWRFTAPDVPEPEPVDPPVPGPEQTPEPESEKG